MPPDTVKYFEGLLSVYTDNIRISDIKSNIILFFLAISIPTVAAFRTQLPTYCRFLSCCCFRCSRLYCWSWRSIRDLSSHRASHSSSSGRLRLTTLSRRPRTTRSSSRSSARVVLRWRRSSTGRFSSSASRWRLASSISGFFSFLRSAGSSFRSRPKATHDTGAGAPSARHRSAFLLSHRRC
jgi:hypothetical protein